MNKPYLSLLLLISVFLSSCDKSSTRLDGWWEATFTEPVRHPAQYLHFRNSHGTLVLTSDEPGNDWYGFRAENLYVEGDSLYFERFWGLEKYYGRFVKDGNEFSGFKVLIDSTDVGFTMKKMDSEPAHLDPALGRNSRGKYEYRQPAVSSDFPGTASLTEAGMDREKITRLVNRVLEQESPNIHSLLISWKGKPVLEEYFYGYSSDRLHWVHSVTKSITSGMVGISVDKGFLENIDEPVFSYFPENGSTKWLREKYDIRIRNLLEMAAGIQWNSLALGEANDDIDMYKADAIIPYIMNKDLAYTPGTFFTYNNGLSLMIGEILCRASGMPADSLTVKYLFSELGIKDFTWEKYGDGMVNTAGGLRMKPRDMLKFGHLFLEKGNHGGTQVIPSEWVSTSTSEKIFLGDRGYAYHWWTKDYIVNNILYKTYYAIGYGEQVIIVVPDCELVFVMTAGNFMEPEHRPFEFIQDYILPSVNVHEIQEDWDLSDFTGDYITRGHEIINIYLEEGSLFAMDPAGKIFRFSPLSELEFKTDDGAFRIRFILDFHGKIRYSGVMVNGEMVDFLEKVE